MKQLKLYLLALTLIVGGGFLYAQSNQGGGPIGPGPMSQYPLVTVASASTVSIHTQYSSVTGSAAIGTITPSATPYLGERIVFFAAPGAAWTCTTAGNISSAVAAVTPGAFYEFVWNGSAWAPSRAS